MAPAPYGDNYTTEPQIFKLKSPHGEKPFEKKKCESKLVHFSQKNG